MHRFIKVLYEDDSIIVFDKPTGLLVIPTPQKEKNTLVNIANKQCSAAQRMKLYPCHRLDRDTSGAIIFAKGKRNQKLVMEEFRKKVVEKKYVAFVKGRMLGADGRIKSYIKDYHQRKYGNPSSRKLAITKYKVVTTKRGFTVVEVCPLTGRTNQIRIHFSERGHPLLGERVYAFRKDFPLKFRRLALHASALKFRNPVTRKSISVQAPMPQDMRDFLQEHR